MHQLHGCLIILKLIIEHNMVDMPGLLSQCKAEDDRYKKLSSAYEEKIRQYNIDGKKKIDVLTSDEEFIIAHYVGSAYNWVNDDLRNGIEFATTCRKTYSSYLDISLQKIESFSGVVYRMDDPSGGSDEILKWFEANKGKTIKVPNYISTSKDKWDHHTSVVWKIKTLPTNSFGKDISMINEVEEEVLFMRNCKFKIEEVNFRIKEISLSEVLPGEIEDIVAVRQYFK